MDRYDRQIRLWGQHGQNKLTSSQVCLINANAAGTEILKNLCLPGIGSFSIIDPANVTIEDVGSNFFLSHNHIGRNRGKSAVEYLLELNDEVCGQYVEESLESLLSDNMNDFWSRFKCIICCGQIKMDLFTKLCDKCWQLNVPLVVCKTLGFIGYLRLQYREHLVIDTHPDNILGDFRLDRPFTKLQEYLDGIDLDADDNPGQHPYVVIIYKFLRKWQSKHSHPSERLPINYEEKQELKNMIKAAHEKLENFQEAYKAINTLNVPQKLPDELEAIFDYSLKVKGSKFWSIIRAIKLFTKINDDQLPVSGILPDMASSSASYIALQNIYRAKAVQDADRIYHYIEEREREMFFITIDEVNLVCKNIRHIDLLSTSPISINNNNLSNGNDEDGSSFLSYHACFKAVDYFYSIYGRYPGEQCDQIELDIGRMKNTLKDICSSLKMLDETLYEICRYGGSELHTVASFMGGCASQEILKLITNQYVTLNNTLLYDSVSSTTLSLDDSKI